MEPKIINREVSDLSKKELLARSSKFIFSTGLNDGTSSLCKENMKYGLAQMHLIQEKYGFEPNALFISSPDETISRNKYRWNSGYGYGGKLEWGAGNDKIVFLNTKPNHCGILVLGLWEMMDPYEIIKKIDEIKSKELYFDDIRLNWDYGISNHFISCFKTNNLTDIEYPPYIFLIHGSAPELRDDSYGVGIYIDKSDNLKNMSIKEETKFGTQYIVLDSDADEYLKLNKKALDFSCKKREIIAQQLFENECKIICNQPHQFLKDYNSIYLGSNCTDTQCDLIDSNTFPIALRSDISAYLMEGTNNLTETTMMNLGFYERAKKLELLNRLKNANITPHGAGYAFPDIKDVINVLEYKDQRYFVCRLKKGKNRLKIVRVVSDLQYEYRKREVVLKAVQLNLGRLTARLTPVFSLKL
ncbi:MAG: hypothetical protein GF311_20870 [Candidatus Lokiarchaeota archaeon]|nr:hypothetical protein [Candidatus Lokiarchaeota archaeon]